MGNMGHPTTVNAVDRQLFYYKLDTHSLHWSTLDLSDTGVREIAAAGWTDVLLLQ